MVFKKHDFTLENIIYILKYQRNLMKTVPLMPSFVAIILCLSIAVCKPDKPYHFEFKSHMIPHPEKAHRGGEDAYFNSSQMLVVADGVGGWNNQGIDPSKYSRFLCTASQKYLGENPSKYTQNPLQVIIRAQKENQNVGSATMVVVTLDGDILKYCYIGDSGFMVIRKYEKFLSIYQYVEQQHSFNFPFQLALNQYGGDDPENSICGEIKVKQGDIIVVGSDGLYDNYNFNEVLEQVEKADRQGTLLSGLAKRLAETAIKRGEDPKFNSPFAQRAKQQRINYTGGKLDDTTVIVARITKAAQLIVQL